MLEGSGDIRSPLTSVIADCKARDSEVGAPNDNSDLESLSDEDTDYQLLRTERHASLEYLRSSMSGKLPLFGKEEVEAQTDTGCNGTWKLVDWVTITTPLLYICLLIFGLHLQISDAPESRSDSELFSFWLQMLTFGWWYVINVWVWRVNIPAINYVDVLSYLHHGDPGAEPQTPMALAKIMSFGTWIMAIAVMTYLCLGDHGSVAIHLVVWAIAVSVLFAPKGYWIPLVKWRRYFVRIVLECCMSAMFLVDVRFLLTWVTDQWTSACLTLWQLEYSMCSFAVTFAAGFSSDDSATVGQWSLTGSEQCGGSSWNAKVMKPIMYLIPFILRFFQEVRTRNWWNVGKYFSAIMMVVSSCLHDQQTNLGSLSVDGSYDKYSISFWYVHWLFWAVVKTGYCYYWDIIKDWGLWQDSDYLRKNRLYKQDWVYYFAMFTNLCGRISWTLALSPHLFADSQWELMFALIEISRRGQWSFFRVENQVINVEVAKWGRLSMDEKATPDDDEDDALLQVPALERNLWDDF